MYRRIDHDATGESVHEYEDDCLGDGWTRE
jgi:hypothetical protein